MTIFVEAIHTVHPLTATAFDRWVDCYGNDVVPALRRHGYDVLGAWKISTGPMGRDLLLNRFESLAEMEKANASLATDRELGRVLRDITQDLYVEETTTLVGPVPYATEQRLERALAAKPESPRQYLRAQLQVKYGGNRRAYELIDSLAGRFEAGGGLELVTAYEARIGKRGTLTDLWVFPRGLGSLAYRPGDPLGDIIGPLREVAPEETIDYLNPLPYSPLQ